jgi:hypothetical protein
MDHKDVKDLIEGAGGKVEEFGPVLPDGSSFAIGSFPLPADHWSTVDPEKSNVPPMPFRMGINDYTAIGNCPSKDEPPRQIGMTRQDFADKIWAAGKYAYRASTMNGRDTDLDPDALLQNLVVGLLGYWTEDGYSGDDWANPPKEQP